MASRFSKPVHGARGAFSLSVVVYHVFNSGLPSMGLPWILDQGLDTLKYGVELFFAISGFVIIGTMNRASTPTQFILDRATRIYPVLWAVLPIAIVAVMISGRWPSEYTATSTVMIILGNFFAIVPAIPVAPLIYPVTWTLSYEMLFYALILIVMVGNRNNLNALGIAIAIGVVFCIINPRALYFGAGVLVALGYVERSPLKVLSMAPGLCLVVFLALWQATSITPTPHIEPIFRWGRDFHWLTGPLAFVAAALAMNGIVQGRGLISKVLTTTPFLWLGTISYSLYIWHPLVLGTVKDIMRKLSMDNYLGSWSQPFFFLIVIVPCLVLATLSARLLEGTLTSWVRRRDILAVSP